MPWKKEQTQTASAGAEVQITEDKTRQQQKNNQYVNARQTVKLYVTATL